MTTRRSPYTRAPQAYHLLHDRTDQTLAVLLDWDLAGGQPRADPCSSAADERVDAAT